MVAVESTQIQYIKMDMASIKNEIGDIAMDLLDIQNDSTEFTQEKAEKKKNAKAMYGEDSSAYEDAVDEIEDDFDYKMAVVSDVTTEATTRKTTLETNYKAEEQILESTKEVRSKNIQATFGIFNKSS